MNRAASAEGSGRVTSKLLNQKCDEQQINKRVESLTLLSGSRQLTVNFGEKEQRAQMSCEDQQAFQTMNNLSNRKMKSAMGAIRSKFGRQATESNYQEYLDDKRDEMEQFFSVRTVGASYKKKDDVSSVKKSFVYVNDLEAFTKYVLEKRGMDVNNYVAIIGIDDGQSSIKVRCN